MTTTTNESDSTYLNEFPLNLDGVNPWVFYPLQQSVFTSWNADRQVEIRDLTITELPSDQVVPSRLLHTGWIRDNNSPQWQRFTWDENGIYNPTEPPVLRAGQVITREDYFQDIPEHAPSRFYSEAWGRGSWRPTTDWSIKGSTVSKEEKEKLKKKAEDYEAWLNSDEDE